MGMIMRSSKPRMVAVWNASCQLNSGSEITPLASCVCQAIAKQGVAPWRLDSGMCFLKIVLKSGISFGQTFGGIIQAYRGWILQITSR